MAFVIRPVMVSHHVSGVVPIVGVTYFEASSETLASSLENICEEVIVAGGLGNPRAIKACLRWVAHDTSYNIGAYTNQLSIGHMYYYWLHCKQFKMSKSDAANNQQCYLRQW